MFESEPELKSHPLVVSLSIASNAGVRRQGEKRKHASAYDSPFLVPKAQPTYEFRPSHLQLCLRDLAFSASVQVHGDLAGLLCLPEEDDLNSKIITISS